MLRKHSIEQKYAAVLNYLLYLLTFDIQSSLCSDMEFKNYAICAAIFQSLEKVRMIN